MATALVSGATGLVGACVVDRLVRNPRVDKVLTLGRRPWSRYPRVLRDRAPL
jgi:uncharacterized protein YbjT (DUF2867 family)